MRTPNKIFTAPYLIAIPLLVLPGVFAAEHRLTHNGLPLPVQKTMDRVTAGTTVKGYMSEHDNGMKVYEAEASKDGRTRDVQVAEDGTLIEIEQQVDYATLPQNVKDGLAREANGAEISKVESLQKHGKLVAYEAGTRKGIHRGEIQVGPSGEKLDHEE